MGSLSSEECQFLDQPTTNRLKLTKWKTRRTKEFSLNLGICHIMIIDPHPAAGYTICWGADGIYRKQMKEFLKTIAGLLLFFAIVLGALTFTRNYNRQPSVILTSMECKPPCWYGIQPGQTNSSQVYVTLAQLDGVNKDSVMGYYDRYDKLIYIYWYFQRPTEDNGGYIYFNNNQVMAIKILTVNSLKLADLFQKLGQPEKYWTEVGYGEDREYLDVVLLYPTKGYLADVVIDIERGANQVEIQDTIPVFFVTYFAPEMFQELLGTGMLIDKPSTRIGTFQPWSGFGTILFDRN